MAITTAIMVPHPPLIIPAVGGGRQKEIQKTIDAYEEAAGELCRHKPETIVLISPHQIMYADYFHISPGEGAQGDFSQFGAGEEKFKVSYDTAFVDKLCRLAEAHNLPAGTLGEQERRLDHGTMVPLYFINKYLKDYKLVRIGLSGLPLTKHYELGECIKEAAEELGINTAIVASGDLSHRLKEDGPYGFQKEGPWYDRRIMEVMGTGSFSELFEFSEDFCQSAGECGHRSFTIMSGALDKTAVEARQLSYEGPFGVGYGVCVYKISGEDNSRNFKEQYVEKEREKTARLREQEDAYVRLARKTVEEYVREGKKPDVPKELPQEMYGQRAGVFVSIKKNGRLRGCIGTIQAMQESIAEEIIENAISASTKDPRFPRIEPEELDELTISVDVLGDTEDIASKDELDVKRYGVIVTKGYRRGLLLPNLEGVDTVEEQISIAKQKAGIGDDEEVMLQRFQVVRHF